MSMEETQKVEVVTPAPRRFASEAERLVRLEEEQKAQKEDIMELKQNDGKIWDALDSLSRDVAGIVGQLKVQTIILGVVATAVLGWLFTKV